MDFSLQSESDMGLMYRMVETKAVWRKFSYGVQHWKRESGFV